MTDNRTPQQKLASAERARMALDLSLGGARLEDIARRLGYRDRSGPHKAIQRQLAALPKRSAEELREQINLRYDAMLLGLWQRARTGNVQAVDRVIRIEEARRAMYGVDTLPVAEDQPPTVSLTLNIPPLRTPPPSPNGAGAAAWPAAPAPEEVETP